MFKPFKNDRDKICGCCRDQNLHACESNNNANCDLDEFKTNDKFKYQGYGGQCFENYFLQKFIINDHQLKDDNNC